jgi:CubicO group peptidase (beta-lactamase class C family)
MKYLPIFLLIIVVLFSCNQKQSTDQESLDTNAVRDSLTTALKEIQANGVINGFSVAIVDEEQVLYKRGFGYADITSKIPYTESTVQNIASISKTLIGIALLKAEELGKLKLDDPISKYLDFEVKNPNFPDEEITLRHLATHTSSIADGDIYGNKSYIFKSVIDTTASDSMEIPKEFNPPSDMTSMEVLLKDLLDKNGKSYSKEMYINEPPGKLFEYTNLGATLAAYVIEVATKEKFNVFTKKHILEPLQMKASGWSFDEIDFAKHSKLYATKTKQLPFYSLITYPDGGFITSIDDMSKYLLELIRGYAGKGTLLNQEGYQDLFRKQLADENYKERDAENPYNDEYNFGIFLGLSAKDYIGHTGGDPGVSSFMFFNTNNKIGRILIINTDLINDQGVQQFFSIWNKLEEFQAKLK